MKLGLKSQQERKKLDYVKLRLKSALNLRAIVMPVTVLIHAEFNKSVLYTEDITNLSYNLWIVGTRFS